MKSILVTGLLGVLALSVSSPVLAQAKQCPSGEHYDTKQQKCVKHGD